MILLSPGTLYFKESFYGGYVVWFVIALSKMSMLVFMIEDNVVRIVRKDAITYFDERCVIRS
jgi:hypothetical protein